MHCRCGFAFDGGTPTPESQVTATCSERSRAEIEQQASMSPSERQRVVDPVNSSMPETQASGIVSVAPATSDRRSVTATRIRPDDHGALRLPILRAMTNLLKGDVVAIYDTHLLKGTRYLLPLRLTEEMCHAGGESSLKHVLHNHITIENVNIMRIQEECDDQRKEEPRASLFRVRFGDRRGLSFSIPASQVENVRAALASRFAERYLVRQMRAEPGNLPLLLTLTSIIPMVLALLKLPININFLITTIFISILGLIMIRMGWDFSFHRGPWVPVDDWSPPLIRAATPRKRSGRRSPSRSLLLGWALKLLGLAYWIIIASPFQSIMSRLSNLENRSAIGRIEILIWLPSALMIYAGYRLCQRRYDPVQRTDARKPILFLRPFQDDASTSLQPADLLGTFTGLRREINLFRLGNKRTAGRLYATDLLVNCHPIRLLRMFFNYDVGTSEESICRFFESSGPVIAIGKPGEGLPTPGAARMYLGDDRWRETILVELQRAKAVVVQPGITLGVRWELEQIHAIVEPSRVLFCLVSFWKDPQAYEELARILKQTMGCDLPRIVPYLDRPSFVFFDRNWTPHLQPLSYKCPALWPLTADAVDLRRSLRPFIEGMEGGEQQAPLTPRWTGGLATGFATCAAITITIMIIFIQYHINQYVSQLGGLIWGHSQVSVPRSDQSGQESIPTASAGERHL
jgi:hypothetical protein